jgi:hypothetical protein
MAKEGKEPVTSVAVPIASHERFNSYCKKRRLTLRTTLAQVMEWFCDLPPAAQRVVLDDVDGGTEMTYADLLEKLAYDVRMRAGYLGRNCPEPNRWAPAAAAETACAATIQRSCKGIASSISISRCGWMIRAAHVSPRSMRGPGTTRSA